MIDGILTSVWAFFSEKVAYYVTFQFIDPFWGYAVLLLIIAAIIFAVCWFFGSLPVIGAWLKGIGGVILLVLTFGLYAYRKGEQDARAHDKPKAKSKPAPKPPSGGPFGNWGT